ncbi:MAG: VTT domain-containing protein [Bacillota bacterium]|nr:VTT domain-containing protein [Bacillota bacterium]
MESFTGLLAHYGYVVLFIALLLELIAFPTPGELLMAYCGFLVFQGKLNWFLSILIASMGVSSGVTLSYFIGYKLGFPFFEKYGRRIHLGPDKLDTASKWFDKYGNKLLIVTYFIPGVRHVTGYFSGITRISFKRFAFNAYLGAIIWTATFISLGKALGTHWDTLHKSVSKYLIIGGIIITAIMLVVYAYKNHRQNIIEFVVKYLSAGLRTFHSLGRVKIVVACAGASFLILFALLIGAIQDFLANEFTQFDITAAFLVAAIFPVEWSNIMNLFLQLSSEKVLVVVYILTVIWIRLKGRNRILELRSLVVVVLGGEVLSIALRFAFHRLGPQGTALADIIKYTFPSEHSMMAVIAYGYSAYLILRHGKRLWLRPTLIALAIVICVLTGISALFFGMQFPSDLTSGYIFGGVWLALNIILLEIFRILPSIKTTST